MNGALPVLRTLGRIARLDPGASSTAKTALDGVCNRLSASKWPEVAFRFSTLTNTGYPVEFSWTSASPSLRMTFEVAPPETDDVDRLPIAFDVLPAVGAKSLATFQSIRAFQVGKPLKFGAWIGLRCLGDTQSFKVYAEVPETPSSIDWLQHIFTSAGLGCRASEMHLRMAGLSGDGSTELYLRPTRFDVASLHKLALSLTSDPELYIKGVARVVRHVELPDVLGLGISIDSIGVMSAISIYAFAKHIYSSDDMVRDSLLATDGVDPVSLALYEAMCGGEPDGRWRHGMVGVGCARGGKTWVQAGIRPT